MELINIENLIILDDANIVKNIKFARNLVKKYNNEHMIFISNEIWQYIDKYMNSRNIRLFNINNFINSQIVIDGVNILNKNEIMIISKYLNKNTEIRIKRFLKIKRLQLDI